MKKEIDFYKERNGQVVCPICGYDCKGVFQNGGYFPDVGDDVCPHLYCLSTDRKHAIFFSTSNDKERAILKTLTYILGRDLLKEGGCNDTSK